MEYARPQQPGAHRKRVARHACVPGLLALVLGACSDHDAPANRTPTLSAIGNQSVTEGSTLIVPLAATDSQGDTLRFATTTLPTFVELEGLADGAARLIVTPGFTDAGEYPITVDVRDTRGATDRETFSLTVIDLNREPMLEPLADQMAAEGETLIIAVSAADADADDVLALDAVLPAFAALDDHGDGTGELTLQPGFADSGHYSITVSVSDGESTDNASFALAIGNVNRAPQLAAIGDQSVAEGQIVVVPIAAIDADGDAVLLQSAGVPAFAVFADAGDGTGSLTVQPSYADSGEYPITVQAFDSSALGDQETLVLRIGNVDRVPILAPLSNLTLAENDTLVIGLSASDPDGDPIALSGTLPAFATLHDGGDGSGTLTLAPGYADSGVYDVTIVATGGTGAAQTAFVLRIDDLNREPTLTAIADLTMAESDTRTIALSASDPDDDPLVLSGDSLPSFAMLSDLGDGTGTLTLEPGYDDDGDYTITISASDGAAAAQVAFALRIDNVNREPSISAIADLTMAENDSLAITIEASDPDGETVTLSADALPVFAALSDHGDGSGTLTLEPSYADSGSYTVTIAASDGTATQETAFVLTVDDQNRAPLVTAIGNLSVAENDIQVIGINASDPDGDPLTLSAPALPAFALLADAGDGTGTLTLAPGFADAGVYSATIIARDATAAAQTTFVLTIDNVNRAPLLATVEDQTLVEGETQFVNLSATDADGDRIALSGVDLPSFATVTDIGDGTGILTLQPVFKEAGSYELVIRGTDDGAPSLLDEITITVTIVYSGANQVAVENALAGTPDWHLDNPAVGREIEGYASATSVNRGDSISLFVNTSAPSYTLEVFRTGWYQGLGARRVHGPIIRSGTPQFVPSPDPLTGLVEADWSDPYVLATRDAVSGEPWATGVYLARLTESSTDKQSYIIFVVRDDAQQPDILFQLPVTTYQAYNPWGGKSIYDFNSGALEPWGSTAGTRATHVSFDRPYAANENVTAAYGMGAGEYLTNLQPVGRIAGAGWDYNMVRWLEYEQYNVGYITNIDTHRSGSRLLEARTFVSHGHDEYWTWAMRDHVEAARDAGVNLAFFASNSAYRQIRLEPSSSGEPERIMAAYRSAALDPYFNDADPSNDYLTTIEFRAWPVLRPEESLIGVQYVLDPVDTDIVVTNSSHWVFANTGLSDGDTLPGLLGYEPDGIFGPSPDGLVVLAESPIQSSADPSSTGTSHMTIYPAPSGASVFATGSLQWSWGLDEFNAPALRSSRLNAAAQQVSANVLEAFGATPFTGDSMQASCVRLVALSDAVGGRVTSAAEIELLDPFGRKIDKSGWNVIFADSERLTGVDGAAANSIDADVQSFWLTRASDSAHPHEVWIDLGESTEINALRYLPRQDGALDGTIVDYEIHTSLDCASWELAAAGRWEANSGRKLARFAR